MSFIFKVVNSMPFFIFVFLLFAAITSAQQAQPILVSTVIAEKGEISPVKEYVGTVQYYAVAKLAAERAGKIDSVLADEGENVKKGDSLLVQNCDILKHTISASAARMEQHKYTTEKTQRDYERAQVLYAENAISLQRFQDVETEYFAQKELHNAYMAELNVLKEENKRSVITAPFDGVIVKRYVNPGEWVSVGATVYELASKRIEIAVNIPQAIVGFIAPGSEVTVSVEGKKYTGRVRVLVPQGNTISRTFPIKIDMDYDKALLSGMDAIVFLPTDAKQTVLMVPRDAVVKREGQDAVFTIDEGKATMVHVEVIGYNGISAGIKSNKLKTGDYVITRGSENITQGRSVTVSPAKGSANKL